MENIVLSVTSRPAGDAAALRQQNLVPAVVYGKEIDPQPVAIKRADIEKAYQRAGESTLIDLTIDDKEPIKVLIQDVQYDAIKHVIQHIDLYKVEMGKPVHATIAITLTGEAPAVKTLGGILITGTEEVEVKCLPSQLIKEIEADVSGLDSYDAKITVADLPFPAEFEILTAEDTVVAHVTPPRIEKEPEPTEAEGGEAGAAPAEGDAKESTDDKAEEQKKDE